MEQYVKGFQRFNAGENVRPVTSCKFLPFISSLLQSATSVITKCDSFFYYKVRWSVITKCDSFFIIKCDKCYYKVGQVLQRATVLLQSAIRITKCDRTGCGMGGCSHIPSCTKLTRKNRQRNAPWEGHILHKIPWARDKLLGKR